MTPPQTLAPALNAPAQPPQVANVLEARRRHVTVIRMRVVAIAVAVFIALWIAIFAQLVTGHDPALSRNKTTAATTSSSSTGSSSSSSTSGNSSSGSATAVTTHQS